MCSRRHGAVFVGRSFVWGSGGGAPTSAFLVRLLEYGRPPSVWLSSVAAANTDDLSVAISFDDGPDPAVTSSLLDVLDQHGLKASFFMLAQRAETHAELARRVSVEGHEVALHGLDHDRLSGLPRTEANRRIRDGKRRLEAVTGARVRYFRPPFGAQRISDFLAARAAGMKVVVWNASASDWLEQTPAETAERAANVTGPGSILLLHDGFQPDDRDDPPGAAPHMNKAEMLDLALKELKERGYAVLTVGQLLARYPPVLVPFYAN